MSLRTRRLLLARWPVPAWCSFSTNAFGATSAHLGAAPPSGGRRRRRRRVDLRASESEGSLALGAAGYGRPTAQGWSSDAGCTCRRRAQGAAAFHAAFRCAADWTDGYSTARGEPAQRTWRQRLYHALPYNLR